MLNQARMLPACEVEPSGGGTPPLLPPTPLRPGTLQAAGQ